MSLIDIKDLEKVLPVEKIYEDTLSPAAKQIGKALETLAKTSRLLLAPFQFLAAQQDRMERFLQKVASQVEEENFVEGQAQIVIPTLAGLSLAPENSLLSNLFINLLTNSIDKTKQNLVHPAFPGIISQLSRDEAVLLYLLKKKNYLIEYHSEAHKDKYLLQNERVNYEELPLNVLDFPNNIWVYMNHLNHLGLAGTYEYKGAKNIKNEEGVVTVISFFERRLDDFGRLFAQSCIPDTFPGL